MIGVPNFQMLNCSDCYSVTFQSRHDGSLRDIPSRCVSPSHWSIVKTGKGGASVAPIHDQSKWLRKSAEVYLTKTEIHTMLSKQTLSPSQLAQFICKRSRVFPVHN